MQKTVGPNTTTLLIRYFGCRFSVLNYDSLQKAEDTFCSDTAILKINNCCQTICDWSMRVPGSWLSEAGSGAILGPTVFDVADFYEESGQS